MGLNRGQCLVILGTLFFFSLRLQECKKLDGYKFQVYSTDLCPRNETEWKERSNILNCTEKNGYTCLPNEHFTELLEFCYTDPWILIEEGLCLYLIKKNSLVHGYKCHNFQFGCPTSSYMSTEIYKQPSCTLISHGCFNADQICKSPTTTNNEKIQDEKDYVVLVATLFGVFITICICVIMMCVYHRKKFPYCKRNLGSETHDQEENIQFIQEQCDKKKTVIHVEINSEKELEETLDDKPLDIPRTKEVQELSDSSPCNAEEKNEDIRSKSSKLVVAAFDLGAIYSGCAFSWISEWSKVVVNTPQKHGCIKQTVPTNLLLNSDQSFCAFGYQAEDIYFKLAGSIPESEDDDYKSSKQNCSDFYYFQKLTLCLHQKDKQHRHFGIKDVAGKPMRAINIFSILIKYLKDCFLKEINKCNYQISEREVDFVITIPALCGEGGKIIMREAAIKAGISLGQLSLAFEEEAAFIYCQYMHQEMHKLFPLQINECVVVDIGGDSVDIAVHINPDENGTLKEMILVNRGQFTGISVDDEFEKFLETIGGKGIMNSFAEVNMNDYLTMLRDFEVKKFKALESDIIRIYVPVTLDELINQKFKGGIPEALQSTIYGNDVTFSNQKLCISNFVFNTFFQNAINNISKFVEKILTKTDTKDIIIIGRLADCKLVKDSLLERFKTYRIIIPHEAGLASLKGAVYFGHKQSQCTLHPIYTELE